MCCIYTYIIGSLSPIHLSAAEVVSALLLEEMKHANINGHTTDKRGYPKINTNREYNSNNNTKKGSPGSKGSGSSSMSELEEACSRAALRLVYTAMDVVSHNNNGNDSDIEVMNYLCTYTTVYQIILVYLSLYIRNDLNFMYLTCIYCLTLHSFFRFRHSLHWVIMQHSSL